MKKKIALLLILVMAISLFAGCGNKDGAKDGEITLRWYARLNKESDSEEVFKLASEMAKEKIGVNLDIIALEDYDSKISVVNASGEDFDIVYTSSAVNNIYQNVADGNLLALDDLLPKYAPKLWEEVGEDIWDGIRINGKIYAVPNQQIFARAPGFMIPTQNIELLGLDVEEMKTWTLKDYEKYLQAIKDKTGSYGYVATTWGNGGSQLYGFEQVLGSDLPGAIRYEDDNPVIVNQYETEEYKEHISIRADWVKKGLAAPMEVTESDVTKYVKGEGEVIPWLMFMNTYKPGVEEEYKKNFGIDVTVVTQSEPLLNSYGLVATMAAINSDTRYPEKAVEFLELLNTDKEFYNLLVYGVEGKHYTKIDDNHIELSTDNPYAQPAWATGNTFNGYLLPGAQDDMHEATKAINDSAKRSPILGFTPDQEPIKLETANCKAVLSEYTALALGILDTEESYKEFIDKLKVAGVDKLIDNLNEQLAAWKKANK